MHIPFYRQMIGVICRAFTLFDEEGREEVLRFVLSQQNKDGGFCDRGRKSDLYYSLFGGLILMATEKSSGEPLPALVEGDILTLKQFVLRQQNSEVPGFIEKCCLVLLQKELKVVWYSQIKSLFSLAESFWRERYSINVSYRSFVFFLTLDAVLPFRNILKVGAKKMLTRTDIDEHSPCSEVAAKVFMLKMTNMDCLKEQELLKSYACKSGGFRAFQHLELPDMLSTAVALFTLNYAGADLRLLKPACLGFIQQHFSYGAFLSGDGDQTADVEYTFYGLLALGVLAD